MAEAATFNAQASLMLLLRQVGVLVGLAAAVALGLYVALWARQPEYAVLFADLEDRDLNQVVEQLTSNNIPYRMDPNGGTVLVPGRRPRFFAASAPAARTRQRVKARSGVFMARNYSASLRVKISLTTTGLALPCESFMT